MKINLLIVAMLTFALFGGPLASAAPLSLTPGQAVQVREGDIWGPATFEKQEGRKYQVKYEDGNEEWVGADRIRVGDAANPSTPNAGGGSAITLEGPFTQINLRPRQGPPRRTNDSLYIKPTTRPTEPFKDITPAQDTGLGQLDKLMECPDAPGVFVAMGQPQNEQIPLVCIDTNKGIVSPAHNFDAHNHTILAVGDGGHWVVTRPGGDALTTHLWEFDGTTYQLRANYTFVVNNKNGRADWARLVGPYRLLCRVDGVFYLIDLKTHEQLGTLQCGDITVHCSQQVLMTQVNFNPSLVRMSDLSIIKQFPGMGWQSFGMDPTGTYVAAGNGNSLSVVKIGVKKVLSQLNGVAMFGTLNLLSSTDLMIGGTDYDTKTGIPVWNYKTEGGASAVLPNGQTLFVTTIDGQFVVVMTKLPDGNAATALATASPEQFVLMPGTHIAVAGDFDAFGVASSARKTLESALENSGQLPDDNATQYKLTITTTPGPTGKFYVTAPGFGPPDSRTTSVDAPSTLATAVLRRNGFMIWKRERKFAADFVLNLRQGQTVEQACAEAGKPNAGWLGGLDIPGYIIRTSSSGSGTLGESTLTRGGFVPVTPPNPNTPRTSGPRA